MRDISSKHNPVFRRILAVVKEMGTTGKEALFLEGYRLCRDAIQAGVGIECLVFSESCDPQRRDELTEIAKVMYDAVQLPEDLFRTLSSTVNSQGIAGVFQHPGYRPLPETAAAGRCFLVLENVQDPGNVGAMIRTADAMGFDGAILLPGTADPYQAKAVRSAMGSTFHLPIYYGGSAERTVIWLKRLGCMIYAAHLGGIDLPKGGLSSPGAILIGNEGAGLSELATSLADQRIRIPMHGLAESLNAACAAAILCYSMHINQM
ncbi:MAG TPA: RNA methyltransferase [Clostridia bacterium]